VRRIPAVASAAVAEIPVVTRNIPRAEVAAEGDDKLIEKFLEGGSLTDDEIRLGLQVQLANAKLFPVTCGSSLSAAGVKNLLNVIKDFAPAPRMGKEYTGHEPDDASKEIKIKSGEGSLVAVVWKTYIDQYAGRFNYMKMISGSMLPDTEVYNANKKHKERTSKIYTMIGSKQEEMPKLNAGDIGVVVKLDKTATCDTLCDAKKSVVLSLIKLPSPVFSYAVEMINKADVDKVGQFFNRVTEENPTLTYAHNAETSESVLSGMGEIQLGILLEQVLAPEQYEQNVATKKQSSEKVEFAIKLPGRTGDREDIVWLPIDAKFPQEDYQRLVDAQDKANSALAEEAAKRLESVIKNEAKTIREKYIDPPGTTDFAIMYLPTEGLYAEVIRRAGLCDIIQREYRVVVAGPTTLAALLNSLQMGFRTLAIEQRSSEVWKLLGAVKTEFGRFGDLLDKTHKKLLEASNTIENASKKSRTIEKKLKKVQELPASDAEDMIDFEEDMEDEAEEYDMNDGDESRVVKT